MCQRHRALIGAVAAAAALAVMVPVLAQQPYTEAQPTQKEPLHIGLEYLWGRHVLRTGDAGDGSRLRFSFQHDIVQ